MQEKKQKKIETDLIKTDNGVLAKKRSKQKQFFSKSEQFPGAKNF